MISQALAMIFPLNALTEEAPSFGQTRHRESVRDFLLRIKDELLWPRILVRYAPPPDEILPNAPDRF